MSDERTGRELTPRPEDEPSAITPREPQLPRPSTAPVERFNAGVQTHTVGLTEERVAQIVRQSGNARMVAFLGALLIVLFIPIYWLYDIGLPLVGFGGRLDAEANVQYVTDVKRGHALYLANCARCHGDQGQGGIGPPLNDQAKLYQAVTGEPPHYDSGKGHLNLSYLHSVLAEGGRFVCGDPASVMPAWLQPKGPLNYREVEDIIQFIVASNQTAWVYQPAHAEALDATPAPAVPQQGWRDPNYSPAPGSTPVPACWRPPAATGAAGTAAPVTSPGTAANPRVIELHATDQLQWVDAAGAPVTALTLVPAEVVEFRVVIDNQFAQHNLHIGPATELATAPADTSLPGIPSFTGAEGPKTFLYTVETLPTQPQFACTVQGHYSTMNGDLVLAATGSPAASPAASPSGSGPAPSATTAAPVPTASAAP